MQSCLDAHAKPPAALREEYKRYQKQDIKLVEEDQNSIRLDQWPTLINKGILAATNVLQLPADLRKIFSDFLGHEANVSGEAIAQLNVFEIVSVPGLFVLPSLLPREVQIELLEKLFHRDLSCPQHLTNIHLHYNVPYPDTASSPQRNKPASYFDTSSRGLTFAPKDPAVHKPFLARQFLDKKLRWMTLGGQYDWTKKIYPTTLPPLFPPDVKRLVESIFPMRAEAAIVNVYSPGDTLSLHRDVSEECNRPLSSISLGCDALFTAGLESDSSDDSVKPITIRLRSGDVLLMSGKSRYAWHGVPRILRGTCPEWMQHWPANKLGEAGQYEDWKGWMNGKRINVNIRQMFA